MVHTHTIMIKHHISGTVRNRPER